MISQEFRYAVRGAVRLAISGEAMTVKEIAEIESIPARFLEQIFLKMRRAGLLHSRRGRSGGYLLAREPEAITLSDVRVAVSGVEPILACLDKVAPKQCADCQEMEYCAIRKAFGPALNKADEALLSLSLKQAALDHQNAQRQRTAGPRAANVAAAPLRRTGDAGDNFRADPRRDYSATSAYGAKREY